MIYVSRETGYLLALSAMFRNSSFKKAGSVTPADSLRITRLLYTSAGTLRTRISAGSVFGFIGWDIVTNIKKPSLKRP